MGDYELRRALLDTIYETTKRLSEAWSVPRHLSIWSHVCIPLTSAEGKEGNSYKPWCLAMHLMKSLLAKFWPTKAGG